MPSYRTVAQAQAEYDAVRLAYLDALKAQSYSISTTVGSRSAQRAEIGELRKQMRELEIEIGRLTRGGIRVTGATPVD